MLMQWCDWVTGAVVVHREWFNSKNKDITHSYYLWPKSQKSGCTVCAAASQSQPHACFYTFNIILNPSLKTCFLPISVQINLCIAPYWQYQADGAMITRNKKRGHIHTRQGRKLYLLKLNQELLTEQKSYLVQLYTIILVTHTCLSWGNPCPAGCSHVCWPVWKRQSDTWLLLG